MKDDGAFRPAWIGQGGYPFNWSIDHYDQLVERWNRGRLFDLHLVDGGHQPDRAAENMAQSWGNVIASRALSRLHVGDDGAFHSAEVWFKRGSVPAGVRLTGGIVAYGKRPVFFIDLVDQGLGHITTGGDLIWVPDTKAGLFAIRRPHAH